jgi:hypothetical protein
MPKVADQQTDRHRVPDEALKTEVAANDVATGPVNTSWDLRKSCFMRTPQTNWRRLYADRLCQAITIEKT